MPEVSSIELTDQRKLIANEIDTLVSKLDTEKRDFTDEETKAFDGLKLRYKEMTDEIGIKEKKEYRDDIKKEQEQVVKFRSGHEDTKKNRTLPACNAETVNLAVNAWFRSKLDMPLTPRHIEACKLSGINPKKRYFDIPKTDNKFRAASAYAGAAGGFTVPLEFANKVEEAVKSYIGVRQYAEVLSTADGREMQLPTNDDTANAGQRIGENTASSYNDFTWGQIVLRSMKYESKGTLIPRELIEDSNFDILGWIAPREGIRIARAENEDFTNGVVGPFGLLQRATTGVTAALTTAVTMDEVINLMKSLEPQHLEDGPNVGFTMHNSIWWELCKLKNGVGEYYIEPDVQVSKTKVLFGYPVWVNQAMPSSFASGNAVIAFGALGKYLIRDCGSIRTLVLNERFAEFDQVGVFCFKRSWGELLDAGSHPVKVLKN